MLDYIGERIPPENILRAEPMSRHTSFRIGGEADLFVKVPSIQALSELIRYFAQTGQEYYVVGRGTNLLVGDKGYRGVILHLGEEMSQITVDGKRIIAQAGASLPKVAQVAAAHGLSGLEFAAGIPGSIGGGVVMNAGAYDGEMKQVVKNVLVINQYGEEMNLDNDTMEFGYRTSIIKDRPFVVAQITLELQEKPKEEVEALMEDLAKRRREKQPLEYPSAGSTFKRPEGYFAGKLIMDAGLRGLRVGDAQVSEKHCGFIIKIGHATAEDVSELMEEVQYRVKKQLGVRLEPEVIKLGEF
ncbi:MAG: UDP-N-acetylmuramate dehydrogenase [Lachnospiraceae bacterium]|nr:UDP-N-acetylmuramate dehydrogenase [Lachnospiraceae bacterium]